MNLKEAAKWLGKSEYTVRRYVKQGKIEATLTDGKYDISEEAILDYMDAYADGQDNYANGLLAHKEQEIRHLRSQLEQMSNQMLKLQDELIESQRRSDTIIVQLTQQLNHLTEQNQLLLEDKRLKRRWYHRLLMWNNA